MLVRLCLGWLFELPNFPEGLYFNYCSNKLEINEQIVHSKTSANSLDDIRIVDHNVLYVCCPYLIEIKKVLISNSCNKDSITVRHITPLTALQSPLKVTKKRLEVSKLSLGLFKDDILEPNILTTIGSNYHQGTVSFPKDCAPSIWLRNAGFEKSHSQLNYTVHFVAY